MTLTRLLALALTGAAVVGLASIVAFAALAQSANQPPSPVLDTQIQVDSSPTLAASTTSARVALSATVPTVWVNNPGVVRVCVRLGDGTVVAAFDASKTTCPSGKIVGPGETISFGIGGNADLAAITDAGTVTLQLWEGYLVPVQTGGGIGPSVTQGTSPWVTAAQSQYPNGATPITASATGTTAVTTATLAGTLGKTTFICGFNIGSEADAFAVGTATITGTITGTMSFRQAVGVKTSQTLTTGRDLTPCVPASATNTGIAVNSIAASTGGNTTVAAWGYQL